MRVMVMVKGTKESEAGVLPSKQLLEEMGAYNQQLIAAGVMKDGAGLKPTSRGARVHFAGKDRSVSNGPFGGKESDILAGFWIWEVKSLDDAIEWARKCPNPMPGASDLEIRPFYEMEDFKEIV
jgi:hypothetical protein